MKTAILTLLNPLLLAPLVALSAFAAETPCAAPKVPKDIKAYCLDFNWGPGGPNGFAKPGLWADADPAQHVAWYRAMGVNVIQTFCVSCNGIVWLTCCDIRDPHIAHSRALKETDWLLNEAGDLQRTAHAKQMIGPHTRLITCLANWNQQDPMQIVPAALEEGIGLYFLVRASPTDSIYTTPPSTPHHGVLRSALHRRKPFSENVLRHALTPRSRGSIADAVVLLI